jgi:multidrug efflux pump subunit AcrB
VLKQPGANTIAVVDAIRAAMPKLRGVPPNVKLAISFDQSHYIRSAVSALEHEAAFGGLAGRAGHPDLLVSLRATGIIGVAIPLSIMATFVLLYFTGQTLNVFTLGGLALGVGRLVDDSIVELENIHRHLGWGQPRRTAVLAAAQEVAMPILVSTITTIVVFLPVLFLTGVARNLFMPLALTIAFALTMSFFVSRTVTPLLSLYALKGHLGEAERGVPGAISRALSRVDHAYARSLGWVLRHRALTVAAILAVFFVSLGLKRFIGTEFFPDSDESQFAVNFKAPIGTRVERTEVVAERIENAVNRNLVNDGKPTATTMIADVGLPLGRTAVFSQNTGPHSGNVLVNLVPRSERKRSDVQAAESVRSALRDALPGTQVYMFVGGIVKRILNFGAPAPIDVEIVGHDIEAGAAYAKQVVARLRPLDDKDGKAWLTDLQISREENYPELNVVVDRQKAGTLGLSEQQVAQTVLTSLVGQHAVRAHPVHRREDRQRVLHQRAPGRRLPVARRRHVRAVHAHAGRRHGAAGHDRARRARQRPGRHQPQVLAADHRRHRERRAGKDLGGASQAVQHVLDELPPPEGFTVRLGGQTEAQAQAFGDLMFARCWRSARLHGAGVAVQVADRSAGDHVQRAAGRDGRVPGAVPDGHDAEREQLHGHHHDGRDRGVERRAAGRLRERAALAREAADRGDDRRGADALRPILMTTVATIVGPDPDGAGHRARGARPTCRWRARSSAGWRCRRCSRCSWCRRCTRRFERFSKKSHAPEDDGGPMGPRMRELIAGAAARRVGAGRRAPPAAPARPGGAVRRARREGHARGAVAAGAATATRRSPCARRSSARTR